METIFIEIIGKIALIHTNKGTFIECSVLAFKEAVEKHIPIIYKEVIKLDNRI